MNYVPLPYSKGMVLRVEKPNFSWLASAAGMFQIQTGEKITILSEGFQDGSFYKYPVLVRGMVLNLIEPFHSFHLTQGFLKIQNYVETPCLAAF